MYVWSLVFIFKYIIYCYIYIDTVCVFKFWYLFVYYSDFYVRIFLYRGDRDYGFLDIIIILIIKKVNMIYFIILVLSILLILCYFYF